MAKFQRIRENHPHISLEASIIIIIVIIVVVIIIVIIINIIIIITIIIIIINFLSLLNSGMKFFAFLKLYSPIQPMYSLFQIRMSALGKDVVVMVWETRCHYEVVLRFAVISFAIM